MDAKIFKKWQKEHGNFITPHVRKHCILPNGYIVELSEGTGLEHEAYYGVTLLAYSGETIGLCISEDRNRSGSDYEKMIEYYNELIATVKKWPVV
jgi:hypothetical protein